MAMPLCTCKKMEGSRWPDADFDEKCLQKFWKLWKLIMQFTRTWNVLEKERLLKIAVEKFWIFAWGNSKIS